MIPAEQLVKTFQSNHWLALRLLEGVSHEESLLAPPYGGNCINWVLGHLVNGRNEALRYLEKPGFWREATSGLLYKTGSDPVTPETALQLETLFASFEEAQADLEYALAGTTPEFLSEIVETRFGEIPRWQHISGLGWHETYHIGQFEFLKALVVNTRGKNAPAKG